MKEGVRLDYPMYEGSKVLLVGTLRGIILLTANSTTWSLLTVACRKIVPNWRTYFGTGHQIR